MKTNAKANAKSLSAYVEGYKQVKTSFKTPTSVLKVLGDNLPKELNGVFGYADKKHKKEMLAKIGERMDARAKRYGKASATLFDAWNAFYAVLKNIAKSDSEQAGAARKFLRAEKAEKQNKKTAEK